MGVATAVAVGGLIISGVSAGVSFARAGKQRREAKAADIKAQAYIDNAKKMTVNRYAELGISKQPYKQESEALIAAGAQLTEAASEGSQRGVGATAGKIYGGQTEAQEGLTNRMIKDKEKLDLVIAKGEEEKDSVLRDLEVASANREQTTANLARAGSQQSMAQGIDASLQVAQQGLALAPTFSKGAMNRSMNRFEKKLGGKRGEVSKMGEEMSGIYADISSGTPTMEASSIIQDKMISSPKFKSEFESIYGGGGTVTDTQTRSFMSQHFSPSEMTRLLDLYNK